MQIAHRAPVHHKKYSVLTPGNHFQQLTAQASSSFIFSVLCVFWFLACKWDFLPFCSQFQLPMHCTWQVSFLISDYDGYRKNIFIRHYSYRYSLIESHDILLFSLKKLLTNALFINYIGIYHQKIFHLKILIILNKTFYNYEI